MEYYKRWKRDTFIEYHDDKELFANKVLDFFFYHIQETDIDKKDLNYIYRRSDEYYVLKCDEEFKYKLPYKNFRRFTKYYLSTGPEFNTLHTYLNLKKVDESTSSSDESSDSNDTIYNDLFRSDVSYTFYELPFLLGSRNIEYNSEHPEIFRKKLQNVILKNYNDGKYTIYMPKGNVIVEKSYFDAYVYFKKGDNAEYKLKEYLNKEKYFFMGKKETKYISRDNQIIQNIGDKLEADLLWVEKIIENFWPYCRHSRNRVQQRNIMDVTKFKETLNRPENSHISEKLKETIQYGDAKDFSTKLANYLDDKSTKYVIKRSNGKFEVDSNKHPLMIKR